MNQYLNNNSWNGNDDDNERIDWGTSSFTVPIKQKKTFTFTLSRFWLNRIFTVVGIVMMMLLKDWLRNELTHCSNQTEANFHFQTFMFTLSRFWLNIILTVVGWNCNDNVIERIDWLFLSMKSKLFQFSILLFWLKPEAAVSIQLKLKGKL